MSGPEFQTLPAPVLLLHSITADWLGIRKIIPFVFWKGNGYIWQKNNNENKIWHSLLQDIVITICCHDYDKYLAAHLCSVTWE